MDKAECFFLDAVALAYPSLFQARGGGAMRRFLAVLGLACLPWLAEAQVPRVGIHPFETSSPTDRQFLTGAADAPRMTIAGELRLPATGIDRLLAVMLLHGSGGISPNVQAWVPELNGMGLATLVVDSFTGRGITSTVADQDRLSRLAMVVDAHRALDLLAATRASTRRGWR